MTAWALLLASVLSGHSPTNPSHQETGQAIFNGERALQHVARQVSFGPRPTGSPALLETGDWILQTLDDLGWTTSEHRVLLNLGGNEITVRNLVATMGLGPTAILGAHYDTRLLADNDPNPSLRTNPVLGANDGGSGAAVLLELARVISEHHDTQRAIRLVFFDAEDNGQIPPFTEAGNNGWIIGSTLYAESLDLAAEDIRFMILVDMVGDTSQRFPKERQSDRQARSLTTGLWDLAISMGYGFHFLNAEGRYIIDDHVPFLNRGIAAVDIIDLDYPHWHTTQDTLDKVSPDSLERVGRLIQQYLIQQEWLSPLSLADRATRSRPGQKRPDGGSDRR